MQPLIFQSPSAAASKAAAVPGLGVSFVARPSFVICETLREAGLAPSAAIVCFRVAAYCCATATAGFTTLLKYTWPEESCTGESTKCLSPISARHASQEAYVPA